MVRTFPVPRSAIFAVADRGAMKIRAVLEADHRAGFQVDDDAVNHRDRRVAGERRFPLAKHRVPAVHRRLHEVHVADLPLVLLLRRDLLAVR